MKHFYSNLKLMLVAFFAFMGMGVWADEVTDKLDQSVTGITGTSYAEFSEKTVNSAAVYAGQCAGGNESIQLRSNNSNSGVITTESGGTVKKIVVTWNSNTAAARELSIYGSNTAYTAATDLYDTEKQGTLIANLLCSDATEGVSTLEISDEYAFIGFRSKSGALYLTSVEITWEEGTVVPPAVAKPVITPNGGTFIGQITATITCETEGATIYYSMNGADPATDGSSPMYGRPLPISETLTLKAIAVKDEAVSAVASATFTQIPSYSTIAQLTALENNATFAFTGEALVVAKPTAKYVYIHDQSGNSLIYDANGEKTADVEVGKTIAANWTGKVSIYRNLFELVPDNAIVVTDDPALPISYPADPISESNINQVVTLKNITSFSASGKNISIIIDGEKELQEACGAAGYNQFGIEIPEAEEGKTYEMVGAVGRYNDNLQFWPITISEAKEPEPEPVLEFYVAGSMNDWAVSEDYKMTMDEELEKQGIKEFSLTMTLKANDELKVVSSSDGETIKNYFPDGEGNNYVIEADGEYTIYCRPNFDGEDGWIEKCLKVELVKSADPYEAALAAIVDGGTYFITMEENGAKYYVTEAGKLSTNRAEGGIFTFEKVAGEFKPFGFKVKNGSARFTNAPLKDNKAVLDVTNFSVTTNNDRNTWEAQVFLLDEDGKFAIRATNVAYGESGWADAGRVFWTWKVEEAPVPQFTYDEVYKWNLEATSTIIVSYQLAESDGTPVGNPVTKKQEANSAVQIPSSVNGFDFNGGWTPYAYYDYTTEGTIADADCTIKVIRTPANGVVHALTDLSNDKAYTIRCDRGALLTDGETIASTSHAQLHAAAPGDFAIISYEDNYYLYSVADQKFVQNTGALSEMPTNGVFDAIQMGAQTDPYFLFTFKIDDATTHGLNTNGTGALNGCVINTWVTPDQGDQYYMIEAADFDATAALAALEAYFHPSYFVTYVVKDAQGNVLFTSEAVPTQKGAKITTLPAEYQRAFTQYRDVDVTIEEQETTVEVIAASVFPFELSTSFDEAKWYNMTIRTNYHVAMGETEPYYPKAKTQEELLAPETQWAFTGDAYNGIVLWNKAAGEGFALTKDGSNVVMREGAYAWEIFANNDGFVLREIGSENNWINQNGGSSGPLQFWNSANGKTDDGSTFRISEVTDPVVFYRDLLLADIETAKTMLETERPKVGDDLFLKPTSALFAYATSIDDAQAVADKEDATVEDLQKAIEDLKTATGRYAEAPVNAPAEGITYTFQQKASGLYLSLFSEVDEAENVKTGVRLSEEPMAFTWVASEGGYYLQSGDLFVGKVTGNDWKLSALEAEKMIINANPVFVEAGADGEVVTNLFYTLSEAYGLIGSDDPEKEDYVPNCYADKKQSVDGDRVLWTIAEYVAPIPAGVTYTGIVEQTQTHPQDGPMGTTVEDQTVTITEVAEGLVNITFSGFTLPMAALGSFPEFTIENVEVGEEDGVTYFSADDFQITPVGGTGTVSYIGELEGACFAGQETPVLKLTLQNATTDVVYFGADQDAIDAYKAQEVFIEAEFLTVERNTGMGYTPTVAEVDLSDAKAFLGVEELTTDMLSILNPDETEVTDFATYDGWFNAEGYPETWAPNGASKINVKFFEAIPDGKFSICDMNGADEVGKEYSVMWQLKNENKVYVYHITVKFVEAPPVEIAISDNVIKTSVIYDPKEASYVEKSISLDDEQVAAICAELGIESLADADVYGYNPTTQELLSNYAGFDGWRSADGDFASWTGNSTVPACVKYTDGKTYLCYNINGVDDQTIKCYWAIANETKAVLVEISFIYDSGTGIASISDKLKNAEIFDLAGRKVQKVQKGGIYVVNGKKVVLK